MNNICALNKITCSALFVISVTLVSSARLPEYEVAEPSNLKPGYNQQHFSPLYSPYSLPHHTPEWYKEESAPQYNRNFGFTKQLSPKKHGVTSDHFSIFAKVDQNKYYGGQPLNTGHEDYLHFPSSNYGQPFHKPYSKDLLLGLNDQPPYDDSPHHDDRLPYSRGPNPTTSPVTYSNFNSFVPPDSSFYLPPNTDFSISYKFPPSLPTPTALSFPSSVPRSEHEARDNEIKSYEDISEPDDDDIGTGIYGNPKNKTPLTSSVEDDRDEVDVDYPLHPPKPLVKILNGKDENRYDEYDIDNIQYKLPNYHKKAKLPKHPYRNHLGGRLGRPYGRPSPVPSIRSRDEDGEGLVEKGDPDEDPTPPSLYKLGKDTEWWGGKEEDGDIDPQYRARFGLQKGRNRIYGLSDVGILHIEGKNCVRKQKDLVDEEGVGEVSIDEVMKGRQMNCLVCEDPKSGEKYETCRYESAPKSRKYFSHSAEEQEEDEAGHEFQIPERFHGKSKKPNRVKVLPHYRAKRYADDEFESEPEPYTFEDDGEDEDMINEYHPSVPAFANDDSCVEVRKKGIACMVCVNPETNGKYKQCSYAEEPDDSFSYSQSTNYGSGPKNKRPAKNRFKRRHPYSYGGNPASNRAQRSLAANSKSVESSVNLFAGPDTPSKTIELIANGQHSTTLSLNSRNMSESFYPPTEGDQTRQKIDSVNAIFQPLSRVKRKKEDPFAFWKDLQDSNEKPFLDAFPELNAEEDLLSERRSLLGRLGSKGLFNKDDDDFSSLLKNSKLGGIGRGGYFKEHKGLLDRSDEEGGMSKMMQEFATKDRSACTKKMKDKMTCYLCNDSDGIKREECMYVVENEPKKVTYKESTHTNDPDGKNLKREISEETDEGADEMPRVKQYTTSSVSPQTYSNVQIMYTQEQSPSTTIFKRIVKYSDTPTSEVIVEESQVRDSP